MLARIEIPEDKKNRIVDRAGHLADEVGARLLACCPATYVAICEAFKSEGIELFPADTQEIITQGMVGLHGGVAMTGVGTCGAVTAATFAISYVVGVSSEDLARDGNLNYASSIPAVESVIDRFEEDYGAIDCLRVRYNRVQRALDLTDPDARILELTFAMYEKEKCGMGHPEFEDGRDQTPPVRGARFACETICELLAMEPEDRKVVPAHLQGLGPQEMAPKLEKVVEMLKEMGWGRPENKISYREYRKLKLKGAAALQKERLGDMPAP
ncbi:MAG: C_GCAxxG_C_C family protein [Thermoleophilia bacterium]|nr:C_GCAxxG_C_C family protein [Thermoleophilia bacterium]